MLGHPSAYVSCRTLVIKEESWPTQKYAEAFNYQIVVPLGYKTFCRFALEEKRRVASIMSKVTFAAKDVPDGLMNSSKLNSRLLHVVLRIPLTAEPLPELIAAHEVIAKRVGSVWIGKIGARGLSDANTKRLDRQREAGFATYLYIIQRDRSGFSGFRAEILQLQSRLPRSEREQIPSYYEEKDILPVVSLWMKIRNIQPVSAAQLDCLRIDSTESAVLGAMHRSMLALAIVYEE